MVPPPAVSKPTVTLFPFTTLFRSRGGYHDALSSENGALHIAFGVTLPKPLDLLGIIWEAAVQDPELRADLPHRADGEALAKLLKKMGRKVEAILTSKAARQAAEKAVEAWPYAFKSYDLESRIQAPGGRSEGHTSELQSLMRISDAVFCLKKKNKNQHANNNKQKLRIKIQTKYDKPLQHT